MAPDHVDALVLDLDARAGLSIARSLGRAGCRVWVAASDGAASGLTTRYAAARTVLPDPVVDFDAYSAALVAALERQPADVTIPTSDSSVDALHLNREAFGRLTAPALGSFEAVAVALSKERTLEVAATLGLPVPRSLLVSAPGDLAAAVGEVGLPCVLKPVSSWRSLGSGGERVAPVYVASVASAEQAGQILVRPDAPVLVQELAGGARETIKLFRDRGQTLALLAMRVDRTWPPLGGSSVMRRTIEPPPDIVDLALRLVAEIGLEGYAEVEFRRDARGRPLLMEINPRLSQSVELAVCAGIDFPRMQLEWARGGSIPRAATPRIGLRVGWLAGDLRLVTGSIVGSPGPRPRLVPTLRAIASDYLLRGARPEGLYLRDPRPVVGASIFALGRLVLARRR